MKSTGAVSAGTAGVRAGIVPRFLLISAAVGFFIGLFEAALLWHSPRIISLIYPDICYVEWFLAPLVDMTCFGLLGLVLGWIAARKPRAGKTVTLVRIETAILIMFGALRHRWLHSRIGLEEFVFVEDIGLPVALFAFGYAVSLLIPLSLWKRLGKLIEHRHLASRKVLAWGVSLAYATALCGVGFFLATPFFPTAWSRSRSADKAASPNIIFITLDTVRADHLSAYGHARPTTPNLDRFARTGVLFENAIAPAPWTLASHASMFTGLLPQQHGADWSVPLSSSPWTLAEILRSRGYETAGFTSNLLYLQKGWGIAQGFENYADDSVSFWHNLTDTLLGTGVLQPIYACAFRYDYLDRQNARELNGTIFRWFRRRPRQPYFVFINYLDAHEPYLPPAPYDHRFVTISNSLVQKLNLAADVSHPPQEFSANERATLRAAYDNCLAYLDNQVGDLLNLLQQSPDWQNTIVIITSDHGEEFGGHGSYSHGNNLYRGALHVPLIIAGPGAPQGMRIGHLVATRQLFSTVLDLAGGGKTPFSRSSLARFWNPSFQSTPFDNAAISELVPLDDLHGERAMISLTTPQWQYIQHRSGRQELYDWTQDPREQDNLAASPQQQAILESLHSQLAGMAGDATGPWLGPNYLQALGMGGSSRFNLLVPRPFKPGAAGNRFRIGAAQALFEPQPSTPTRPSRSERDLMRSLPYQ